ncbi:uncharacterized protein LOC111629660 [Centruroides sculpturatus]|uniref:uncharacterized protein LOC111629660 n=1 Tax=Centruroides sculpturatus TaxID=218467 RepID=UPI000C6DA2C8|nr:uncharacterized protein LOC111629660 [Centruroides sculpturatus]
MGYGSVLLLSVFVANAVAGPLKYSDGQCARHCTENNKLRYEPSVYTYDYESDTITTIQGTTHEESRMHMKTKVMIEVVSKCELVMRLRETSLENSDPRNPNDRRPTQNNREFADKLQRYDLRFSFQDGIIENICATEDEEPWVLNIKKGILSTLQNSMDNLEITQTVTETDVAGKCTSEYTSLGRNWRNVYTVRKTKDLLSCTERSNVQTALQGSSYTEQQSKSLPLLKGVQVCEQKFSSGILESATCIESHTFRPFSKQSNGAVTRTIQKLTFSQKHNGRFAGNDYRMISENLLFNHNYEKMEEGARQQEAEQLLATLCSASKEEIRNDVPRLFSQFIYVLKTLQHPELMAVNRRVERICAGNSKGRKFFTDAVATIGTTASVKLMKEMIERNEVASSEAEFWMTSLAFITNPTSDMINTLTPLLDGRYEQALLGVSGLIHTFCQSNPDCGILPEVRRAVRMLVNNLGENCYSSETRKVLLSLKAIGNIGEGEEAQRILQQCYHNPQLTTETRLAAIQAYRRFSCYIPRDDLLKLYTNYEEDSELRIASYLAVMRCANHYTMNIIKNTLENEVINQVGSFVWTHLVNTKESENPVKKDIKEIVSNLYLMNKYNTDARKFSRAMEYSMFFDSLNVGTHAESNIIYSPQSYIPRSAMFNLTVDVLGSTVNLFEIGGRLEHVEKIVERLFGPKGYFSQSSMSKIVKNWRQKRAVSDNKIGELTDQFDAKTRFNEDPYASMYLKIFGNEMWYSNLDYLRSQRETFDLNNFLRELAREQDVEFSKSFMFLDATYTIPTGNGFPLRLAINGTATVGLKVGGKFDVRSLKQVDIRGRFQPSGAVEISSLMTVDAGTARSGLKMVATLHSSTWMDGLVEMRDGQIMKVQLNVPKEKMEIIDVQSRIFLLNEEKEREQTGPRERSKIVSSCTGRYTNKILGMELCSQLQVPESVDRNLPLFPMSGAAVARVFIRKTDRTLTSFNFEAKWNKEIDKKGRSIRSAFVTLNTPGSSVDRELTLDFQLNEPEKSVSLKLKTPIKKLGVSARYTNEDIEKRFDIRFTIDDLEKFVIQSSLRSDTNSAGGLYSPALEVIGPNGRLIAITGSAHIRHGERYNGQLTIEDATRKPISLNANLDIKERERYEIQFGISSSYIESNLQGFAQLADSISSKLTLDYQIEKQRRETIDIIAKFRDLSASSLTKYAGTFSLLSTAKPQYTTAATWEMQRTTGHMENTLQINLGDGRRSRMHKITLQEIVRYQGTLSNNKAALTLKMIYPERNIDFSFDMKHENTEKQLFNKLNVQYAPNRVANVETEIDIEPNQFKGGMKVSYPGRDARLAVNAIRNTNEYRAGVIAQWQRGRQLAAQANFRNIREGQKVRYESDAEISYARKKPISISAALGIHGSDYTFSGNVDVGKEKYSANGNWVNTGTFNKRLEAFVNFPGLIYSAELNLQGDRNSINGNADFKTNSRHIVGKLRTTNTKNAKSGSLEIQMDAERDPRNTYVIEGQMNTGNKYQGSFNYRSPSYNVQGRITSSHQGNILDGVFKTNHHVELEWNPRRKVITDLNIDANLSNGRRQLVGSFSAYTPFVNYEDYALSINHNDNGQDWRTEANVKLPRGKTLTGFTEGRIYTDRYSKSLNAKLRINTPYSDFERINADVNYNSSPNELNMLAKSEWSIEKNVGFGIATRHVPNSDYRVAFNFTSHYELAKILSANVILSKSKEGYRVQSDAQWDIDQKVSILMDGKQTFDGYNRICEVVMQGSTPFRGYENLYSKITYKNDKRTASVDGEATWGYRKISGGISGAIKSNSNNRNLEGKLYITTPFQNFENFQVTATHLDEKQRFKSLIEVVLPRNSRTITLKGQGKLSSISDAELNLSLTSPFKNFERISTEIVHRINGDRLRTIGEMQYGTYKITGELTGTHSTGNRAYNTELYFQAVTPFRGYEDIKASVVNNRKDYSFLTILQLNFNQDYSKLQNKLKMDNILNFEEELQITSPYIRNILINVKQEYRKGHFKHILDAKQGRERMRTEAEYINSSPNYGNNIELKIKATSPFETLRSLDIDGSFDSNGRSYTPKVTILWNGSNKIAAEANLLNNRYKRMETRGTITTTFNGYEFYSASGSYDITTQKKSMELNLQWDSRENKQISSKGSFVGDRNSGQVELNVKTPGDDYNLNGDYVLNEREKSFNLEYQYGWKKIQMKAKRAVTSEGSEMEFLFTSPYKSMEKFALTEGHAFGDNTINGQTSVQWNEKKIFLGAEFIRDGPRGSLRITFKSPFQGYELALLEVKGDLYSARKTLDSFFQWNTQQKYQLNAIYEYLPTAQRILNIVVRTPFKKYDEISFEGRLQNNPRELRAQINYQCPLHKLYFDGLMKHNGVYPTEMIFTLDSPFSPFRKVKFTENITKQKGQFEFNSNLEWEGVNKIEAYISTINKNRYMEVKAKVNTPFKQFRSADIEGSIANENANSLNGKLNIRTPFQSLQNLEVNGSYQKSSNSLNFLVTVSNSDKKFSVAGSYVNSNLDPFEIKFNINAPFTSFRTFNVEGNLNVQGSEYINGALIVSKGGEDHSVTFRTRNTNGQLDGDIKFDSRLIYWKKVSIYYQANYVDSKNMDGSIKIETPYHSHRLSGNYRSGRRDLEATLRLNSPRILIHKEEMVFKVIYNTRRNRLDFKASIDDPLEGLHKLEAFYNNDNREITVEFNLNSSWLSFKSFNAKGKFINSNDRNMEVLATILTPSSTHSLEGIIKNYDTEKDLQIKLISPLFSFKTLTLTGSMRNDNSRNMDGSLTIATPSKELRISGNMKRITWNNFEAFVTINTPFEWLKVLRVDSKYLNDRNENIEGNLEIQSSNENMRKFGISGKYHHGQDVEELSVNLRLPSRQYPTVGLLSTLRHVPGSFSPRITISLPGKRYSIFSTYEHKYDETTAGLGYEWGREKAEINGHLKFNDKGLNGKLSLTSPFKDYENQEASLIYSRERSRHNVALTYKNARNEIVNIRGHAGYYNNMNFNVELNFATPYRGFEDVVFRMRQENRRNRFATTLDCTWSRYKKVAFTLEREYNNTHNSGYIYVTSPYELLRTMKMDYATEDNYYNTIGNAQLEYNNKVLFKTEASSLYDRNTRNYNRNFVANLPTVPFTISVLFKPLTSGAESTIKTNYPSRSISLHTEYQLTKNHFNHGAELTWDEKMRRSMSYEMRLADIPSENDAKEFYARLNLPIRSMEVRGKHAILQNGRNMEMNVYWDVARDAQKYLTLKMEHEDQSNWQNTAHKLRVSVNHPRLSKDIVATAQVSSSKAEAFGKLELEYSRYQQHNMMLEGRLRNMARGRRDTNYVVYVTARHPISNTDLKMMGEIINNDEEASVNMRMDYIDRQQRQRIEELKGKISKLREQIDLIAKSDNNQLAMTGRMFHMDNEFTLALEEKINERPPVHSHVRLSKRNMNMDLNITTPSQENMHVRAAMPNDAVHFEISHTERGRRISDVLFNLGLKESRILKSRMTWRPQIWQNVKDALSNKYNEVSDVVIVKKDKIVSEFTNEFNAKKQAINQAMLQELGPFKEEMSRDMDRFRYDVKRINNDLYTMYQNDEFYIQTTSGKVGAAYEVVSSYTEAGLEKAKRELEELKYNLAESYDKAAKSMSNYYRRTTRKIVNMYNRVNRQMYEFADYAMENLQEYLYDLATVVSIRISQLTVYVVNTIGDFVTRYAPWMETYYENYKDKIITVFRNFLEALYDNAYYKALREYWIRVLSTIEEFSQQPFSERFERVVNTINDNLQYYYETGREFHDKYIRDYYRKIYEQGSQMYRTLRLDVIMNALAESTYQKARALLMNTARGFLNEYTNILKGTKCIFEPHHGKIILEIPLPYPKRNLKEALDYRTYPEFQKLVEFKDTYLSNEDYCIWDTYYKYKHYLEESLKVPPFDAYAMIAGNQHFVTFDKTHFDFLGECSYLLTRDFVDGNFTVIVNYARVGRHPTIVMKSLTILSDDKKIDIGSDYKITVDDTKVELPQLLDETLIMREGSVVVVENGKGIQVRCNFIHNLCTVHVSGFYFGKTAGLFGTYDYEPQLDMMTPDRRLEKNVEAFVNSWEVSGGGCRKSNMASIVSNDYRVQEACKKLFDNKNSIFRPCYKQVDPLNFYNMCLKDLARYAPNMFDEKICTSAAAYRTECSVAGVPVRMPKSCVRCEKHDGNIMNEGDVIKITNAEPVQSADVVFIVEKKPCNRDHVRMLGKLAQDIENSLSQKEYTNIKYAVVGFGGQNIQQPHLQTSDGEEFVDFRSIDSAFSSLINDWSEDDKQTNSVFEAIRYAAALPFRTGSAKTFILLKCSDCKAEDVKADYSEMLRTLLDGDVVLHLMMEHEFEMKNSKSKGKRILGIDKKVAYTLKDWKDPSLRGDRDLLAQLKIPKDFCVPLALEVNGSLFGSQILRESKRNVNKKFIDVFSRRVAKTATPSECQVCECISTSDGIGKSVCQRCVSPIIANMISPDIIYPSGSSKNDDDDELSVDLLHQLQDPLNEERSR